MTFTEDIHIASDPSTVFDILADIRNETRWNEGVSHAEMTTDGPVGPGSTFITDHGAPLGRITSTITRFDRPDRLDFESTSTRMDLTVSYTFTATEGGTLARGTFDPKPRGIMAVLFPLLRPMIRRDMAKQHQHLAALCEEATPDP